MLHALENKRLQEKRDKNIATLGSIW
ncbi:putative zinc finger CCCH domain-containing protein 64 [Bienertia sinuspersici]